MSICSIPSPILDNAMSDNSDKIISMYHIRTVWINILTISQVNKFVIICNNKMHRYYNNYFMWKNRLGLLWFDAKSWRTYISFEEKKYFTVKKIWVLKGRSYMFFFLNLLGFIFIFNQLLSLVVEKINWEVCILKKSKLMFKSTKLRYCQDTGSKDNITALYLLFIWL